MCSACTNWLIYMQCAATDRYICSVCPNWPMYIQYVVSALTDRCTRIYFRCKLVSVLCKVKASFSCLVRAGMETIGDVLQNSTVSVFGVFLTKSTRPRFCAYVLWPVGRSWFRCCPGDQLPRSIFQNHLMFFLRLVHFNKYYSRDEQIKGNKMGETCSAHGAKKCIQHLVGKPKRNRRLRRPMSRWKDNIEMDSGVHLT
jgi:hypothetical protein